MVFNILKDQIIKNVYNYFNKNTSKIVPLLKIKTIEHFIILIIINYNNLLSYTSILRQQLNILLHKH